jgi:hypothetical protein
VLSTQGDWLRPLAAFMAGSATGPAGGARRGNRVAFGDPWGAKRR